MTKHEVVCRMKPYIQPFERRLALLELEALAGASPTPDLTLGPFTYRVSTSHPPQHLVDSLTYWEAVCRATKTKWQSTRQVRREATANVVRNGIAPLQLQMFLPFKDETLALPNRRILRYGPHGAHEYRGKFFPQLVRALITISGAKKNEIVMDPMCGSGTTLVEASVSGYKAFGADMNPLSVFMSRTKCAVLSASPDTLRVEYESLKESVLKPRKANSEVRWIRQLPDQDQTYLARWFSPQVLADLDCIATRINGVGDSSCRELFRLCLSNILRRVSWQKEGDLRVRREVRADADIDAVTEFLSELNRTVRIVLAFLYEERGLRPGEVEITEADARSLLEAGPGFRQLRGKVKTIITSPPYATALPYLDTDRLSLCFLGLLSRPKHRSHEYRMIGNREVTGRLRSSYWSEYQQYKAQLPRNVTALIDRIERLNGSNQVGFRRRNLPALLAHYFLDIKRVFEGVSTLLKPGGFAYVVIGNNHTVSGDERIDIETDRLLASIGQSIGLTLEDTIPMELLVSRDIFKRNTLTSETILCFRK